MRWIGRQHGPLHAQSTLHDVHVSVRRKCGRKETEHRERNTNHDDGHIFRRAQSGDAEGQLWRAGHVIDDALEHVHNDAKYESADKKKLNAGRHTEITLALIRIAHEHRN
eukprot:2996331-Prymnesium_polylepis.1